MDGQTIAEDTLWTRDKTWLIDGNVGIAPGYTLTIEAGTEVRFTGNYALNVGGTLIAAGTADQPIRFSGENGAAWNRLFFDDPGADAVTDANGIYQGGSILRHVTVDGAANGIDCTNATPYLDHLTLTGGGMECAAGDTALWVQDSDLKGYIQISEGSGVDSVMGTWATRTPMPTARYGLGAAIAPNGKIYAIGGGQNGFQATVEEYDPTTDTWATRTPMLTSRYGLGVATAPNGKLYAIGGNGGETVVEEYNPTADTWVTRASMPTARYELGVVTASNGKIYAIGGCSNGTRFATVEEYDPATDTWTTRSPMHTPRSLLAVTSAPNGKLYVVGGVTSDSTPALVEEYDPATDSWQIRTSMPTARTGLGMTVAPNGKLYGIGGSGGEATVEEYNPVSNIWMARSMMPTPRYSLAVATASNGKIYAIGGYGLSTVEEYTLPTNEYGYNLLRNTLHDGVSLPGMSQILTNTINGGISIGTGSLIQNNTVTGGSVSVGDGSTVRDNRIEDAPGWAIQTSGNVTVQANRLVNNANGILASGGVVRGNLIANTTGVGLEIGSVTVEDNTFTGNGGSAIKITSGTPVKISGNNFEFNRGAYDIENRIAKATLASIDALNNWWGTTTSTAIRKRIFDFNDDYTLGTVQFSPTLTEPSTVAPAYVRSVTLTPASPVGIQSVEFEAEFSREMDPEFKPLLSFALLSTDFYSDDWLTPNRYRTVYDFSTLIPRGIYTLTVSGAVAGGMEIASHTATTFTVDYAGAINDTTPPPAPAVTACSAITPDTLSAEWRVNDPESAVTLYQYAIGSTPAGAEVVNWTTIGVTTTTRTNLALTAGQMYYLSVKARNEGGLWSGAGRAGVTAGAGECASGVNGPDLDGVDDHVENNAPNSGDGNNDGIPDSQQANVASLSDATGSGHYLTLAAPANLALRNVRAITNPAPSTAPAGVTFAQAFVEFEIENLGSGGAVSVTLTLHGGAVPADYWKYGPTPDNATQHWYTFNYDGTTGAVINGNQVTLYFIDGQRGDSDLTANGRIVDPGGAGSLKVYLPIVIKN